MTTGQPKLEVLGIAVVERAFPMPADEEPEARAQRHASAVPTYLIAMSTVFALYVVAVRLCGRSWSWPALSAVMGFGALYQGMAIFSPDMLSGDLYSYVVYGRMFGVYGANPYEEVPAQYPSDPFAHLVFWKYAPSFYGPLWTLLSGALARAAGHDQVSAVLWFKGATVAAALAAAPLIAAALGRLRPELALGGTLLFAWNPLLVVETGLSGHNDALVLFFVALTLALVVWRQSALAVGSLVLAAMVKVAVLPLVPLLAVFLFRREPSWARKILFTVTASIASTAAVAACLGPIWAGPEAGKEGRWGWMDPIEFARVASTTFGAVALGGSGDRYVNGLGELALGELRVYLGETREDTEVPLQFTGWWVATHKSTKLRAGRGDEHPELRAVEPWSELLIVGPEKLGWSRAFDPESRQIGFVPSAAIGPIDPPSHLAADPEIAARAQGPTGSPTLQTANQLVRWASWSAAGLVWLAVLVIGTATLSGLLRGWLAFLLAMYYAVSAWFWPWYLLWALPVAALVPPSIWARWLIILSWGVLLLYATLGFGETDLWFLQTYRSLGVFGLPLILLMIDTLPRLLLAVWRAALGFTRRLRDRRSPGAAFDAAVVEAGPTALR